MYLTVAQPCTHICRVALPPRLSVLSALLGWREQLELGQHCQPRYQPFPRLATQHSLNLSRGKVGDARRLLLWCCQQLQQVGNSVAAAGDLRGGSGVALAAAAGVAAKAEAQRAAGFQVGT